MATKTTSLRRGERFSLIEMARHDTERRGRSGEDVAICREVATYRSRFEGPDATPFEEFFSLVYFYAECDQELTTCDKDAVRKALKGIEKLGGDDLTYLNRERFIEDGTIVEMIRSRIAVVKDREERERKVN